MGIKGIIGVVALIVGTVIQGIGTVLSVTDTTERFLDDAINGDSNDTEKRS